METVFITIHDLSEDARIKYCSDSIEDILGYLPHEVAGKPCWEYFHPDEIPFAREIHGRGVHLDKAAVINYCRVRHKDGSWVGCECVFTVVHDVLVASTAVYRRGPKARQRALDGAGVRRIFSSSPRDPRYHMLSYLSNKFEQEPSVQLPEPRAALFLNRFTRTSTIMYATDGVSNILGLQPGELVGKSFYYCIEENCLREAVKCLESAKANDSIAYLRFWYRNPLQGASRGHSESIPDRDDSDEDGGMPLGAGPGPESTVSGTTTTSPTAPIERSTGTADSQHLDTVSADGVVQVDGTGQTPPAPLTEPPNAQSGSSLAATATGNAETYRTTLDNSTDREASSRAAVSDPADSQRSMSSETPDHLEIEAVVSCTSDGLVVILRRAQPFVPQTLGATESPFYANGLFASPWAPEPVLPPHLQQATVARNESFPDSDSDESGFMAAIRDVAVFAWSLTGINGSLAEYARGKAAGEALPPDGLPIWDPNAIADSESNELFNGYLGSIHRPFDGMNEPSTVKKDDSPGSSEDEVIWKRTSTLPPWRRPKRRGHGDAFGTDESHAVDGGNEQGGRKRATRSYNGSGSGAGSGSGSGSGAGSAAGSI